MNRGLNFLKNDKPVLYAAAFIAYTVLVAAGAVHHEVWRDEVRAFSIATGSGGLSDLIARLHNEGHPIVWYLLLRSAHILFPSPLVLKIASGLAAVSATALLLFRSPCPWYLKLLWPFGLLPLWEYSVSCRNYGVGMMLLFIFLSILTPARGKKPGESTGPSSSQLILGGLTLALLANTSIFGLILSCSLFVSLLLALIFQWNNEALPLEALNDSRILRRGKRNWPALLLSFAIMAAGVTFALTLMLPDQTSTVTPLLKFSQSQLATAIFESMLSQGGAAKNGVYFPDARYVVVLLLSLYFLFIRKPSVVAFLFLAVCGIEMVDKVIYPVSAFRHAGTLFIAILSAYWLDRIRPAELLTSSQTSATLEPYRRVGLEVIYACLFLIQIYLGVDVYRRDLRQPLSSAKALCSHVSRFSEFDNAIFVAEPDYMLESIPYYLPHRLYFLRENSFGKVSSFTSVSEPQLSLGVLFERARALAESERRDILILIPPGVIKEASELGRSERIQKYGNTFSAKREEAESFVRATERIGAFKSVGDENYELYRLRAQSMVSAQPTNSTIQ